MQRNKKAYNYVYAFKYIVIGNVGILINDRNYMF